jgi:hypothetical protein
MMIIPRLQFGFEPPLRSKHLASRTGRLYRLCCPFFDGSANPHCAILFRIQPVKIGQPEFLAGAGPLEDLGIPDAMRIRPVVEPTSLRLISAFVIVITDIARQVKIINAMHQNPQCKATLVYRLSYVPFDRPQLINLLDDYVGLRNPLQAT